MSERFHCPYCNQIAQLVHGDVIYPHRPDLHRKPFYRCAPCDAYVGCHPGTTKALGKLANARLRRARNAAHAAFDPVWKQGHMKRTASYAWLSEATGIPRDDCHIAMMDERQCAAVVDACKQRAQP